MKTLFLFFILNNPIFISETSERKFGNEKTDFYFFQDEVISFYINGNTFIIQDEKTFQFEIISRTQSDKLINLTLKVNNKDIANVIIIKNELHYFYNIEGVQYYNIFKTK